MSSIDDIKKQYRDGRISRRCFMEGALAAGMTVAAASAFTDQVKAATPKRGGRLRTALGHGSTTDSLDPATYENDYMIGIDYSIHNHIGEVQADGSIQPELVESWEPSSDVATWTFKVRQGVEFHNGKTLDAHDFVASVNHHRGETKSPAKSVLSGVKDIRATDKNTFVVELEAGNADLPFSISDYHVAIKPAKDGKIDATDPTGTGPYTLEEHEAGVRSFMKRNPNYFKDGKPYFDEFELLSIIDVNARTNALKTGEVDTIDRVDLKTVHLLQKTPGLRVEEVTGTRHFTLPMRTDTAPFDDNNVRMALKHALDREAVLKTVLRGHGRVGNDHPIAPSNQFHADGLPQRTYDPDKAKHYLKQAGLSSLNVSLHAADAAFAGAVDAAVLYKEHAANAGITIEVVREPNDGYWSNVWMNKPWSACYWSGRPTEDWMFSTAYACGADWNDTFWCHDRFNELLVAARAELDDAKRREMYFEMQQICRDEGGTIVPMFANYVFAMSDKVQTPEVIAGNWYKDGAKWMERWWFA